MGRTKVDPISIQMKLGSRRPTPVNYKAKKDEMMKNNLVEGLQEDKDAKGWLHNIVITAKAWDSDEIRIFRLVVLVMGTPPESGECDAAIAKILEGVRVNKKYYKW